MDVQQIYFRLPVPMQELAVSVRGMRLRWLRYGPGHRRILQSLRSSEGWGRARMDAYGRDRLFAVMRHATETVPFYRLQQLPVPADPEQAPLVLREWPLLTKSEVQDAGLAVVSEGPRAGKLTEIHTGGTGGNPPSGVETSRRDSCSAPRTTFRRPPWISTWMNWLVSNRCSSTATRRASSPLPVMPWKGDEWTFGHYP
jgi:phenylacetate-CoA ligase